MRKQDKSKKNTQCWTRVQNLIVSIQSVHESLNNSIFVQRLDNQSIMLIQNKLFMYGINAAD